jgi:hypothetical protein
MESALLAFLLLAAQISSDTAKSYAEVLAGSVKNGRVDYQWIRDKKMANLDAYLDAIESAKVPQDRLQAVAFYVDAYNAWVIKQVIVHKIPRSVLDVSGFFDAKVLRIAGKTVSLNQLEKQILLPVAQDPRTHMVLVCGAVGCPILEDTPYAASDMNARLDTAARRYLAGPTGASVTEGSIKLSKIFEWYQPDFGGVEGVIQFVRKYAPKEKLDRAGNKPNVTYMDYNWTLNAQ